MEDAAKEVPPFAADSVRMARQMGRAAVSVLVEQIQSRGKTSFLALEGLREAAPDAYHSLPAALRAEIYGQALSSSHFYNAWGVPGYQLTDTAEAFIALGKDAANVLGRLLDNKRDAPLAGSKAATTSAIYGNRVCDYAWVFISEIRHQPYSYSQNTAERDRAISELPKEE